MTFLHFSTVQNPSEDFDAISLWGLFLDFPTTPLRDSVFLKFRKFVRKPKEIIAYDLAIIIAFCRDPPHGKSHRSNVFSQDFHPKRPSCLEVVSSFKSQIHVISRNWKYSRGSNSSWLGCTQKSRLKESRTLGKGDQPLKLWTVSAAMGSKSRIST